MSLAIRTRGNPLKLAATVRSMIQSVDKDQPVYNLMTMEQKRADLDSNVRVAMQFSSILAALALGLAALGIYGVLAYSVAQRTHEIGVRMALGARAADVLRLVVGHGMGMVLLGLIAGLLPALALTQLLRSEISRCGLTLTLLGLPTFVGVFLFLGLVVLVACYLPARKAAQVDPMVALRYE